METEALRQELADLTAAVRAFVEWHAITGTTGLPAGEAGPVMAAAELPVAGPARVLRAAEPVAPGWSPTPAASMPDTPSPSARVPTPAFVPPSASAPVSARAPASAPASAPAAAPVSAPASSGPDTPETRRARLVVLAEEVRGCQKCGLAAGRTQTVFHRGDPSSELVFIGEGPGMEEDLQGEPFVGAAGQLLDKMIVAMGYRRDQVYICNIVKCRPPSNRKPEPAEMAACTPYLVAQLDVVKPKVVVALGATAVQGLFGTTEGITKLRGKWRTYKGRTAVMPTFHPAYLLRQPGAKREVWSDLKEVMRVLGRPVPDRG
ncbi:MAG TPA: uracil-DNA glycosylase family protein [Candidatus Nanopelagicales bacterium]|nr:uracil-DNA glycosylase family protein [Candidatus Nanopelagicales bacterium]